MLGFDPRDPSAALLWTQVMLTWAAVTYLHHNDPVGHQEVQALRENGLLIGWRRRVYTRGVVASVLVALLPGLQPHRVLARAGLAAIMLAGAVLLPLVRTRIVESYRHSPGKGRMAEQRGFWVAEWELAVNVAAAVSAWGLITACGLSIRPWIRFPGTPAHLTVITGCAALILVVTGAGSFLVRGVLNKVGALPRQQDTPGAQPPRQDAPEQPVDLVEFSRGRIIGVLERLIVLVLMAVQAYQAIAFLMAAKGLIRSRDLESRDFAEYFLIGTLASMALALVGGVAVQLLLKTWS